jgi:hypothetical protein
MNKINWRKLLLKIHLYGGLFAVGYFVVFILSALMLNHDPAFLRPTNVEEKWANSIGKIQAANQENLIKEIKDSLGIIGNTGKWSISKNKMGNLVFKAFQPSKVHRVVYKTDSVYVTTTKKGFWHTLQGLHFVTHKIYGAKFNGWYLYSYICTTYLLFAIISGLWLWVTTKKDKIISWVVLSGVGVGSGIVALYIYSL